MVRLCLALGLCVSLVNNPRREEAACNVSEWRDGFLSAFQICCLIVFLVIVVGRAASLRIRSRVNPIALRARKRGMLGAVEIALFVQVNVWAAAIVMHSITGLLPPGTWVFGGLRVNVGWVKVLGILMITSGFVLFISALWALGSSWRLGIDENHPGGLVTTGVYALSRNPIYAFFDLYFIGTFLVNGTWLFFLFALLCVLNLHYQILHEERFLAGMYGDVYRTYCERTARYWIWQRVVHLYRERATG